MPRSSMLNVPYTGLPTVESKDRPAAWQRISVNPDMFGAGSGRALQQLGSTIEGLGDVFGALEQKNQAEQAETAARQADTEMMKNVTQLQTEFNFKTAEEQSNGFADYDKRLKEITTDYGTKAAGNNKRAQKLILGAAERYYQSGWRFGFDAKTKAVEKHADEVSVGRINQAVESASIAADEQTLGKAIGVIDVETERRGARLKWSAEKIDDETFTQRSNAFTRFIGTMASRDPTLAQKYFDTYYKEIASSDRDLIDQKIKAGFKSVSAPKQAEDDAKGLPPSAPQARPKPPPATAAPPVGDIPSRPIRGGQLEKGNIDLSKRKGVKNEDGTTSTVLSSSFNIDGKEVLLPTLDEDGKKLTNDEVIAKYKEDGKHLGIFKTPEAATAASKAISAGQGKRSAIPGSVQVAGDYTPVSRQSAEEFLKTRGLGLNQVPIGMTVNNPGNLKYTGSEFQLRNFPGISKSHTRDQGDPQAAFDSPQAGMNAAAVLAVTKYNQGMTTVGQIIAGPRGWTKGHTLAAGAIASTMGVGVNEQINLRDPKQLSSFLHALVIQEHGGKYKDVYPKEMKEAAAAQALGVVPEAAGEERPIQQRTLAGYQESKTAPPGSVPKNLNPAATSFAGRLVTEFPEVRITSGYRDPEHNRRVGGRSQSQHLHGKALDLDMSKMSEEQQAAVLDAALRSGAKGIGYYGNGKMHIDFRDNAAAWGPDTSSATLGQTPQWFRQRAALLVGGKIVPDSGPAPSGRVQLASRSDTMSNAPQPGFQRIQQSVGPGNMYAQVQTTSGTQLTTVDQTPRTPITADTSIEELNARIKATRALNTEAGHDEAYNDIYEQHFRAIHARMKAAKEDNQRKATSALEAEIIGNIATGKPPAKDIAEVISNPDKPELKEHFSTLPEKEQLRLQKLSEAMNADKPHRRATEADVRAFTGYMGMATADPDSFLAIDFADFKSINIDDGHRRQLIARQLQMKQKGTISNEDRIMDQAMKLPDIQAQLRAVGITPPTGTDKQDAAHPYYLFEGALEAEVKNEMQRNGGKVPQPEWIKQKSNELLRAASISKGTESTGGMFGWAWPLIGKGGDKITYEYQFPERYRKEMETDFKAKGWQPTPARQRAWLIDKRRQEAIERLP